MQSLVIVFIEKESLRYHKPTSLALLPSSSLLPFISSPQWLPFTTQSWLHFQSGVNLSISHLICGTMDGKGRIILYFIRFIFSVLIWRNIRSHGPYWITLKLWASTKILKESVICIYYYLSICSWRVWERFSSFMKNWF